MADGLQADQVGEKLRAMSRDGSSIEAAQVKLIGLDEIREAAGPRWPRMRERVRSGSLNILAQHTTEADVVIPAGDGFLIMLAEGRPGDAQRRCQVMRDALLSFYLGEEALASLRPEVQKRSLDAAGLTDLISSSMNEERRLIAKAQHDEIAFAPLVLSHEQREAATLAVPITPAADSKRIAYNPDFILDGRHQTPQDFLELDIALLDAALSRSERLKEAGNTAITGVCIHASTMQSRRSREGYLKWLTQVDPAVRRTMFVTIQEIERGTPLISITEWTSALRAVVSHVCLDFHYTDHAISSIGSAGAWAAGFQLPMYAGAQHEARAQRLRDQIGFWAKSLRAQGMRLVVHGYQEASFLEEAGSLGVSLFTSDAHWPFSPAANELVSIN